MITLYQLDQNAWFTGETMQISEGAGFIRGAGGWADIAPPSLSNGELVVFLSNNWVVTRNPSPALIEPEVEPVLEPAQSGEGPTVA
jgi:hypothetical protein